MNLPASTRTTGTELLKPAPDDYVQVWLVSRRVNSSRAPGDDPALIEPGRRVMSAFEGKRTSPFAAHISALARSAHGGLIVMPGQTASGHGALIVSLAVRSNLLA